MALKESNFQPMTMEEITAQADAFNCDVVVAAPNELQFDLDAEDTYHQFGGFFHTKLRPHWPEIPDAVEWRSKSGKGWHCVVTLPESLSVEERIALQAMGGSDYGREFASWNCYKAGSPHPILLFKPRLP